MCLVTILSHILGAKYIYDYLIYKSRLLFPFTPISSKYIINSNILGTNLHLSANFSFGSSSEISDTDIPPG